MNVKKFEIKELDNELYMCFWKVLDFSAFYYKITWDKLRKKDIIKQAWIWIVYDSMIFIFVDVDSKNNYVDVMIHEVWHAMWELFESIWQVITFNDEIWANYLSYYVRQWLDFLKEIWAVDSI